MTHSNERRVRLGRRAAAVVAGLLLAPALASAGQAAPSQGRVDYLGHTFLVPAGWKVVDLAETPRACVRFDVHALYLGTPGSDQDCPAGVVGATEGLLVQPAAATSARRTTDDRMAGTITADAPGLKVTASYGSDRSTVVDILTSAGFAAPVAAPKRAATGPAVAAAVSAASTNHTGQGFDVCDTPSNAVMDGWRSSYGAVGVYIGGLNRSCKTQANLTASWVSHQAGAGWHFLPLYVGLQASHTACTTCTLISDPVPQGAAAADDAADIMQSLGFPAGALVYYDMEFFSASDKPTALPFLSSWTQTLHRRGYLSGVYGSAAGGINYLADEFANYTMPDVIDFAAWPGSGSTSTSDSHIPSTLWDNHQRVHQWQGGHDETHGGYTLNIDNDYFDVQVADGTVVGVQIGDLNADGLDDLVQMRANGQVVVFWNSGANPNYSWSNNRLVLTGMTDPSSVRIGDFNGDHKADLLQIRSNGDAVVFWNSGANPNFSWSNNRLVLTAMDAARVQVGDLNNDGLDDVVQTRPNGDVVVFWNSGANPNFSWSNNRLVLTAMDANRVRIGDLDNNGLDDLVQIRPNGDVVVFWNSGTNPNYSWSNNRLVLTAIYL